MSTRMIAGAALVLTSAGLFGFIEPRSAKHGVVFQEPGRFGGWPANHGAWSWGREMLVGFEVGQFRNTEQGHAIDYTKPAEHVLARSSDAGETWTIERPEGLRPPPGEKVAGVPTQEGGRPLTDCSGGVDFTNPGFAFTARMTSIHAGQSRFYYSSDRGKTWEGPCRLPDFGQKGIAARTDYLVNGKHDMTMFLTAAKSNGREGRVICVRTTDGARTWKMLGFVTPEPEGNDYAIMPSSVRLGPSTILTAVRYRKFIDLFRSTDDGQTWENAGRPAAETGGNPPSLTRLKDRRLVLTYGYRQQPYGIRARVSKDDGSTWGEEIVVRSDGGNWDLGYPRTLERPDGKLVTVYYFNSAASKERFIASTIWQP
ncbi:MAG TPA: sialidase family protein [Bryobacteraceae bacterium]|nr:sialidase family protein [Bryobacteraceae bacterium]